LVANDLGRDWSREEVPYLAKGLLVP
jgi:hypothetical protein